MENFNFLFQIAVLIFSVVIHEISHGYAARAQGDPTAEYRGRLTLNPFAHLEVFGSFLVPLISYLAGSFIIGWAKPVPYNPYNLKFKRWGEALVALAGPASNLLVALLFGLIIRFGFGTLSPSFIAISATIVFINVLLAVFNMVPIPPLDGSKVLFSILPQRFLSVRESLERYGLFFALLFLFFFWQFVTPAVSVIFTLITGLS
jgi:Zn-dependent protease